MTESLHERAIKASSDKVDIAVKWYANRQLDDCPKIAMFRDIIDAYHEFLAKRGFILLPKDPSQIMVDAGMHAADDSEHPTDIYAAMISNGHGPDDVGMTAKTLVCSACDATVDAIVSEPERVSLVGLEGWTLAGGKEYCPTCKPSIEP